LAHHTNETESGLKQKKNTNEQEKIRPEVTVQAVWKNNGQKTNVIWQAGGQKPFFETEVLLKELQRSIPDQARGQKMSVSSPGKEVQKGLLRVVRESKAFTGSSHGQGHNKQLSNELADTLCELSQHIALGGEEGLWKVKTDCLIWERITLPHLTSETGSGSWPTPCTRDYKGANAVEGLTRNDGKSRMDQLPNAVAYSDNNKAPAGQLNPDWVEWLMGWPIGWTIMDAITELDWRDWSIDPADGGEVPRVATGIKNRVGRLKAIGNGQVPQVAAMAWKILTKDN